MGGLKKDTQGWPLTSTHRCILMWNAHMLTHSFGELASANCSFNRWGDDTERVTHSNAISQVMAASTLELGLDSQPEAVTCSAGTNWTTLSPCFPCNPFCLQDLGDPRPWVTWFRSDSYSFATTQRGFDSGLFLSPVVWLWLSGLGSQVLGLLLCDCSIPNTIFHCLTLRPCSLKVISG